MASHYRDGKTYTVTWRLKGRRREYAYGIKTLSAAKKAAAKRSIEEELARAGLHTPPDPRATKYAAHAQDRLAELYEPFAKSIRAKGRTPQHAQQQASHVRDLVDAAKLKRVEQLESEPIQAAAKSLLDGGLAPRTVNAKLQAAHQFGAWLRKSGRWPHNLLIDFERFNEEQDRRRPRRELSEEELEYLIEHVEQHGRRRSMIAGRDRAMLYRVALYTGFRQAACLTLTTADCQVDPKLTRPFVGLWAGANKNRRYREQPVPRDFAAMLHAWLAGRPAGQLWRPSKHAHRELWMRRDLEAARAAWLAEAPAGRARTAREKSDFLRYQDSRGRYADFHGWRHTGISRVVRHAGLKAGQVWADHSSPVVTAKYAHMNLFDEAKSLEALPPAKRAAGDGKGKRTG